MTKFIVNLDENLNRLSLPERVKRLDEFNDWCSEHIGEKCWSLWEFTSGPTCAIFKFKNDYTAFKLRVGV